MNISKEEFPDHILMQVVGRLDTVHAKSFETYISETIRDSATAIVIDMSGVDYVASSGLRSLLIAAKQVKAVGRDLSLSGLQPSVREVFDISGFSTIFRIA
ncbi:STAS domain-containing protein [Mesorhizobium australicum]|uniref:Anti-sigma factor antagonist n=1 Tax=Mesorhizobium australicum TaxID=536018 RepID=A0A1X7PP41_9HYPH|nr:STAS domain-containing protein [Mesorhizobium australicum]SMH53664.1 anti-sigma B factor antagonist [Mesorhizobium australicum]